MHQRSSSPHDLMRKLQTDRSEYIPCSSRNSQSNIFDFSIPKNKNSSQLLTKNDKTNAQIKPLSRKNSVSSYYFRNYKKNGKNTGTQSFSKYLKSKKQQPQADRENPSHQNQHTRKRCITTINLITNKNYSPSEASNQKQAKVNEYTELNLLENSDLYCKKHPTKLAYFEVLESNDCYCHQCSIDCVKQNVRLIQLCPSIQKIKKVIEKKVEQTKKYGSQLYSLIEQRLSQNIKDLESQYIDLKKQISTQNFQKFLFEDTIIFELKEIDWSFLELFNQLNTSQNKISQLQFLEAKTQNYKMKISQLKSQEQPANITIHEFNEEFEMSPVPLIESTQKQRIDKIWNLNPKPKKNLMKEIQNALNYQSRNSKCLKVKTISLKGDGKTSKAYQNYLNQENMQPNIMKTTNDGLSKQDLMDLKRISFGNYS